MANPTAGVPTTTTPFSQDDKTQRGLANTAATYYIAEAIGLDTSGNAVKCDDTASLKFDGLAAGYTSGPRVTVESTDAAGDKWVKTERPRFAVVKIAAAAAGDEGKPVWWLYSNEVSLTANTYKNFAGYIHRVVSSTEVEVQLDFAGPNLLQANLYLNAPPAAGEYFFLADRPMRVIDIKVKPLEKANFTATVYKVPDNTAPASGTALHTGTANLNGTNNINQSLTLGNSAVCTLAAGDGLAFVPNANATAFTGVVSVVMAPTAK